MQDIDNSLYYDVIFLMESNFQENIIAFMRKTLFPSANCLVVDARPKHFIINGTDYHFNVSRSGGNKHALLFSLIRQCKLPHLVTAHFIVPYPTSNFFVLEKHVSYSSLSIFDDGLGTLMGLVSPGFFQQRLYMKLRWYAKKILYALFNINLQNDFLFLKGVSQYYSVYPEIKIPDVLDIKVTHLNYLEVASPRGILPNEIGFIGYPPGKISDQIQSAFEHFIRSCYKNHYRKIIYFPHPREDLAHLANIKDCIILVRPEMTFEEYLRTHPIPENIIAPFSSVLVNLKTMNIKGLKLFYVDLYQGNAFPEIKKCYQLFGQMNIPEWNNDR